MLLLGTFFCISSLLIINVNSERVAIAHLNNDRINGTVYFHDLEDGIHVRGTVTGLNAGEYGFHVHELGDTSTCDASGAHFDPDDNNHGGRNHTERHVGDLGNIMFIGNDTPVAQVDFVDTLISLRGRNNILGRTLVLHEERDDLGLGGNEASLLTGNAGPRVACGVIGIYSGTADEWNAAPSVSPSSMLIISLTLYLLSLILG